MNAGAECVLHRIWATLQDQDGIHAESLFTCLGALAGYACQIYVRQAAALPGADPRKHTLLTVDASDGTYSCGDALMAPVVESPLSVWALVGRAVQKLGKPLPDIQDILRHVSQTVGTSAFDVPRLPDGRRPRHPASVYLKHLWPQILPIAQRFCRKPMQLPVLFGIALQRAIERTKDTLSPTLSASIAMECAVAMAKVALPEAYANPPVTRPTRVATETDATPGPMASGARHVGALVARLPPAARIVTIASLAFMTVAGAMYEGDRMEPPETVREERELTSANFQAGTPVLAQATESAQELQSAQEAQASQEQQFPEEVTAPTLTSDASAGDSLNELPQLPREPGSDGGDEGVMRDEFGQPLKAAD